jgi:hypothetical protein
MTVIPRGPKPKPPLPLHRYMYHACRDIEHITRTALTCPPTDSWSQYLLTNIVCAVRKVTISLEAASDWRRAREQAAQAVDDGVGRANLLRGEKS